MPKYARTNVALGFCETGAAVTVNSRGDATMLPILACIFVVPDATAVTIPPLLIDPTWVELLVQEETVLPYASGRLATDPSEYLPMALNCSVLPVTMVTVLPGVLNDTLTRVGVGAPPGVPVIEAVTTGLGT